MKMKVTVVGGGLGGLACAIACKREGFDVTVIDQVKEFLRVGDSIGFGSNSARLLYRWGVGQEMEPIASNVKEMQIYNFNDSETLLGVDDQIGKSAEKYGCRQLIGHRGDFHMIMANFCKRLGVEIRMDTKVIDYQDSKPSVILESGEEIKSDVVICAEGVKSSGRKAVLGVEDKPLHSGYGIYRAFMPGKLLKGDPLAEKFTRGETLRLFLAPDMHAFVTSLRNGEEVNAVLTHKDTEDIEEGWTKEGKREDVLKLLEGWDPAIKRVWEKMPTIIDWKLVYRPCLDKWISDSGLIALMGDAAHPFLPTSVQGASQAIEDGATIAKCLAKCQGNIPLALQVYFDIRHDYVAEAQSTGIKQRDTWHNVHEKDSRAFKKSFNINSVSQNNLYLWENDAEKLVDEKWDEVSSRVRARLQQRL